MTATLDNVPGLTWHPDGRAVLAGPVLDLTRRLDQEFRGLAHDWNAEEHAFPALISAAALHRVDYFRSFPHLATFATGLRRDEANLADFADGAVLNDDGGVRLVATDPVTHVLTPAACYHIYPHLSGTTLHRPTYLTTRNTCFRRETSYRPLQRQWGFTMREIVCVGTAAEVRTFVAETRASVDRLLADLGVPVDWVVAGDPFFRPGRNPSALMQRLDPVKHEMVYAEGLALGSSNVHYDHFGAAFDIARGTEPAHSGCVAFGVERWAYAVLREHGAAPRNWPDRLRNG